MSDKQLQQSLLACGISDRQIAQHPSVRRSRRAPQSPADTVTDESSSVMIMPPHPSFSSSVMLDSIVGESFSISAESVLPALIVENKGMLRELARQRLPHLILGNMVAVRNGDDSIGINGCAYASDALALTSSFDFAGLIIGCHFGPPVCLLI